MRTPKGPVALRLRAHFPSGTEGLCEWTREVFPLPERRVLVTREDGSTLEITAPWNPQP